MFKEFEIDSYRGLNNLELKELKKVNVFVGPNNCGKTSILEAIILSGFFGNIDLLMDALMSRYHGFSPELFEAMFPIGEKPVISLTSQVDNDARKLHTNLTYNKRQAIAKDDMASISDIFELQFDYKYNDSDKHDHYYVRFLDRKNSENYNVEVGTAKKNIIKNERPCKFISFSRFDQSAKFFRDLDEILNKNMRSELIDVLQIFDDQIVNFEVVGTKRMIKIFKISEEKPLTLYDYGNGMYKAFYIAVSALLAKGGVLLVDEIEAGIHNKALDSFIQKLLVVCEKNNVQLFFTTHSLEAIDVMLSDHKDKLEDIAFYHIRRLKEYAVAKRYSGAKLLDLRSEIGFDIR